MKSDYLADCIFRKMENDPVTIWKRKYGMFEQIHYMWDAIYAVRWKEILSISNIKINKHRSIRIRLLNTISTYKTFWNFTSSVMQTIKLEMQSTTCRSIIASKSTELVVNCASNVAYEVRSYCKNIRILV